MTDRNRASDESNWLAARTAELAANGHARQRREWRRFAHREAQLLDARRRAADTACRRIKLALLLLFAGVTLLLASYPARIHADRQRRAIPLQSYQNRPR
jgi:hypothetical protein